MLIGAVAIVQELVGGGNEGIEGRPQGGVRWWERGEHFGEAGTQDAEIDAAAEEGNAQTLLRRPIALGARCADKQAMQGEATQIVGDTSGRECARRKAQECGKVVPEVPMAEAARQERPSGSGRLRARAREGRRSVGRPHVAR
jgi:hypothetical protein